jgi:hypothetical protein
MVQHTIHLAAKLLTPNKSRPVWPDNSFAFKALAREGRHLQRFSRSPVHAAWRPPLSPGTGVSKAGSMLRPRRGPLDLFPQLSHVMATQLPLTTDGLLEALRFCQSESDLASCFATIGGHEMSRSRDHRNDRSSLEFRADRRFDWGYHEDGSRLGGRSKQHAGV